MARTKQPRQNTTPATGSHAIASTSTSSRAARLSRRNQTLNDNNNNNHQERVSFKSTASHDVASESPPQNPQNKPSPSSSSSSTKTKVDIEIVIPFRPTPAQFANDSPIKIHSRVPPQQNNTDKEPAIVSTSSASETKTSHTAISTTRTRRGARRLEEPVDGHDQDQDKDVEEVEYPRQQLQHQLQQPSRRMLLESVSIPIQKPTETASIRKTRSKNRRTAIASTPAPALKPSTVPITIHEPPSNATTHTLSATAAAFESKAVDATFQDELAELTSSRLSISPPPALPMFKMKDTPVEVQETDSPWLMEFDSSGTFNQPRLSSRLSFGWSHYHDHDDREHAEFEHGIPDSPSLAHSRHSFASVGRGTRLENLAPPPFPNPKWLKENLGKSNDNNKTETETENDGDDEHEDDDPFGFLKAERQLKRAQILRPPQSAASRSRTLMKSSSPFDNVAPDDEFDTPTSVEEILASKPRRRGETRNKGKGVDRPWLTDAVAITPTTPSMKRTVDSEYDFELNSSVEQDEEDESLKKALKLSKIESELHQEEDDKDLRRALQMSLCVDHDSDVGMSSSFNSSNQRLRQQQWHSSRRLSHERSPLKDHQELFPLVKETLRSIQTKIRSPVSSSTSLEGASLETTTSTATYHQQQLQERASRLRSPSPVSEPEDLICAPSLSPQKPAPAANYAVPSTPPRTRRPVNYRFSMGGMDESPIMIERTPTKKPEAGMPASMESPPVRTSLSASSSAKDKPQRRTGGMSTMNKNKKRKYMRTEQLEAMLPRPKKKRVATTNAYPKSSPVEIESGPDEEDELVDTVEEGEGEEEEEDEEDEPLIRRRHYLNPATKSASESKKQAVERTPVVTRRRNQVPVRKPVVSSKETSARASTKAVAETKSVTAKNSEVKYKAKNTTGSNDKTSSRKDNFDDDRSGWTDEQWAAHEERIRYFAELDDYELEVETIR
ncbi:hypothetical protein BGZ83_000114 [Gryganskiella cystojenkinii]|nr:hypothetical protein BGZ83_000114 [Gryganskiella cystojenkinii]